MKAIFLTALSIALLFVSTPQVSAVCQDPPQDPPNNPGGEGEAKPKPSPTPSKPAK